ncbi:WD40-repeat-containing domain protein [Phycomyces blakesleeanus]
MDLKSLSIMGKPTFKPNPDTSVTTTSTAAAASAGILLTGFDTSPTADHFALVTHGIDRHRLRIFNVRSGTVNNDHTGDKKEKFTSLTWGHVRDDGDLGQTTESKANKRRRGLANLNKVVALGTNNGTVVIYSLIHGAIVKRLAGAHTMAILDFILNKNGTKGYSLAEDNYIVEWDIEQEKEVKKWKADVKNARKLKLSHDETRLATAGHTISLWDLASMKVLKKYTGHASGVTQLAFSHQDDVLVSSAEDDRYVNVWDAQLKNDNTNNLTSLTLENNVAHIDFSETETSVLAVSEDGIVGIWQNADSPTSASASSGPRRKTIRSMTRPADANIKVVSSQKEDVIIPIIAARYVSDANGKSVMIARGSSIKPVFEVVPYVNEETGALLDDIVLSRQVINNFLMEDASIAANNLKTTRKTYDEASVMVVGNTDFSVRGPKMHVSNEASAKNTIEEVSLDNTEEPSIEQKLQQMNVEEEQTTTRPKKTTTRKIVAPSAGTLQNVLIQALHSNDVQLLEACLSHTRIDIVHRTVQRLPANHVIPLLFQLISRFQEKPNRGRNMLIWINAVLTLHTAYLMTVPDLVNKLSGFYQALDSRVGVFPKLLSLRGRLDMVQSQIDTRSRHAVDNKQAEEAHMPLNVYVEEDSDNEAEDSVNEDDLMSSAEESDIEMLDIESENEEEEDDEEEDDDEDDEEEEEEEEVESGEEDEDEKKEDSEEDSEEEH